MIFIFKPLKLAKYECNIISHVSNVHGSRVKRKCVSYLLCAMRERMRARVTPVDAVTKTQNWSPNNANASAYLITELKHNIATQSEQYD